LSRFQFTSAVAQNRLDQRLDLRIAIERRQPSGQCPQAGIVDHPHELSIVDQKQAFGLEPVAQLGDERQHLKTANFAGAPQLAVSPAHHAKLLDFRGTLLSK
jgi:hypothetical protein